MREGLKYKRGDVRQDGRLFWHYNPRYKSGEVWLTKEKYDELKRKYGKEYASNYYKNNKDKYKKHRHKYLSKNKDKTSKRSYDYKIRNRDKINHRRRIWTRERLKADPCFRLMFLCRNRINDAIRNGTRKSKRTKELLGCSPDELRAHLESKFKDGMNWENWGQGASCWQIDHIRPISSFDLTDPEQQGLCFHYTNLQPLWAVDNWTKSDKWDETKNECLTQR